MAVVIAAPLAVFAHGSVTSFMLATTLALTVAVAWLGLRHGELRKDLRLSVTVLLWAAGILGGVVLIKVGLTRLHDHHKWVGEGYIVIGLTFIVLGAFLPERPILLLKLLLYGFGTTRVVLGVSLVTVSGHYMLRGIAAIVAGVAAIMAAKALRIQHKNLLGSALVVTGLATCVGAEGYWADHRMQSGIAVLGIGAAFVGGGVSVLLGRRVGWALIGTGCAIAVFGLAMWQEYNSSVLAAALEAFGTVLVIGGVRDIGVHEIVSRVPQVIDWLKEDR